MQESYNVKPGDHATIINSANGEKGPSVGRRVLVLADKPVENSKFDQEYSDKFNALNDPKHYCPPSPYEKEHTTLGKIWPVVALDGKPFISEHGGVGKYVDVPDRWLEKLPPAVAIPKVLEASL
jgi:hypothetical protein